MALGPGGRVPCPALVLDGAGRGDAPTLMARPSGGRLTVAADYAMMKTPGDAWGVAKGLGGDIPQESPYAKTKTIERYLHYE